MEKKKCKILYANPIFLDYRLPFYKGLNDLFKGSFYVLYSTRRYKNRHEKMLEKIPVVMGENAIPYTKEVLFNTHTKSFKNPFSEKGQIIPFTRGLLRTIWKLNPDVILTEGFYQWTPLIIVYSILKRKPVFMGYERTLYTERNVKRIHKLQRKLTDKFISGYFVNGIETTKYLLSLGIDEKKIHLGGMNADSKGLVGSIEKMSDDDRESFRNLFQQKDGLLFLFSGQIIERKGVNYLLDAWKSHVAKYKNDVLILIGVGDLYEKYKKECGNMSSIYFEGRIDYNNVYKYYAIADVFVLPTIEDNWSLVVPEAMACGLPVTTSIYNGCHTELVKKDVNGITFDPYKIETLIEALDYFHQQDLKKMGEQSIEMEKYFNTENCTQRVYKVLANYIDNK